MSAPVADLADLGPLFIFYDTETTGLDTATCEIVELAACAGESTWWTSLIKPKNPVPAEVTKFNGISDDTVKDAGSFAEVVPLFFEWVEGLRNESHRDVIMMAHNSDEFDEVILRRQCKEHHVSIPSSLLFADTLPIFRRCFASSGYRSNSLAALARRYGVTGTQTHRARGDVDMLMRVVQNCPDKALVMKELTRKLH